MAAARVLWLCFGKIPKRRFRLPYILRTSKTKKRAHTFGVSVFELGRICCRCREDSGRCVQGAGAAASFPVELVREADLRLLPSPVPTGHRVSGGSRAWAGRE